MADKISKIREWVSYKQDSLMDEDGYFEYPEDRGAYNVLSELDDYINSLQEEPVSKQKHSNVERTVKDWKEEPVSEDIEKEIDHAHKLFYEEVGWDSDEGARAYVADWFAYYFAKWQKQKDSILVSEELEKAAVEAFKEIVDDERNSFLEIFKAGAKWQKEQMMKDAVDGEIKVIYRDAVEAESVGFSTQKTGLFEGDKVKLIIIKED